MKLHHGGTEDTEDWVGDTMAKLFMGDAFYSGVPAKAGPPCQRHIWRMGGSRLSPGRRFFARALCVSVVKLFLQGAGEGPGEVGERRVGSGGRGDRQDVARGESGG